MGVSATVIEALEGVTKRKEEKGSDEGYQAFVRRAGANPLARAVKKADLLDNLDVTRLKTVREKDRQRMDKYLLALRYLSDLEA
jgi:hypothetical protein